MGIIGYIVIGLIAGALAKLILPGKQGGGILKTMLLGIVGALVGGLLSNLIFHGRLSFAITSGWFISLVIAVVGSIIVLVIWGAITKRRGAAGAGTPGPGRA